VPLGDIGCHRNRSVGGRQAAEEIDLKKRGFAAIAAAAVLASMMNVGPVSAQTTTTYEVLAGADYFGLGIPGFSGRFYPGSIKVHRDDVIKFDFPAFTLGQEGDYPQDVFGEYQEVGHPENFLDWDPDDGEDALKVNLAVFSDTGDDCGSEANPCVWGPNDENILPAFPEEPPFDVYVRVDAAPGTTLWAASLISPDANVNLKVEVVDDNEAASTQEELDHRAELLFTKDFENIQALYNRMSSKATWHRNGAGQKVYDIFVGAAAGPLEIFASFPRTTVIPQGARTQFHFMSQMEPHTATFGGPVAKDVLFNQFVPACDPDGDDGLGPDLEPTGFNEETGEPICPDATEAELDINDALPWAFGDGSVTDGSDYQNSGLIGPYFPDGNAFSERNPDPMAVRFPKASGKKGFKFICLLHGGFMGGKVIVKK
jgi:hypothetical protein